MTRAHRLYAVGATVLGVHVLDDTLIQPQPGTGPGDHLAGALVPIALLALAVWAFPRLSGAGRGALALITGILGAISSIEAIHYTSTVGPTGDDFTGLLAVPAALLLLGLGAVTLWTTRRTTGNRVWRYGRRAGYVIGAFLLLPLALMPLAVSYVGTHVGRSVVPAAQLGAPYENVAFETGDGLELHGWYVPSRNGAAVIAFPGRKGPQRQARLLARHGYGVLLFDRRGEGVSDGDPNGWGWGGTRDLDAAIRFLRTRPDVDADRIGGIGLSVGGEMMLDATAHGAGLAAVVAEGAGSRIVSEEVSDVPAGINRALTWITYQVRDAGLRVFGHERPPEDLEGLVARIAPKPVFLINAMHHEAGAKHSEYIAAAREPKQAWLVPKGGHTGAIDAMPQEYERRVIGFLDRALARRRDLP